MSDPVTGPDLGAENPHLPETPAYAGDVDPEETVGVPDVDPEAPAELSEPLDAPVELDGEPGPGAHDDA